MASVAFEHVDKLYPGGIAAVSDLCLDVANGENRANSAAYMRSSVYAKGGGRTDIEIRGDHGVKLWVHGELAFSQLVDSVHIDFAVDVYRIDADGTLWVCVDTRAELATPLGIKPSLVFRKRPDGSAWVQL